MGIETILALVVFAGLMGLSAFFSSSETALFSLGRLQLERMDKSGHPRAHLIARLLNQPRHLIVTILIGNELVNVAASVISAAVVIQLLGAENKWVNLLIMVPVLLLFGEITPKTLAIRNNVTFASFQCRFIELFARAITPLRSIVRHVSEFFITLIVGGERSSANIITEDLVRFLAQEAIGDGVLDDEEALYINRTFDLGDKLLRDVMTPRSRIVSLSGGAQGIVMLEDILEVIVGELEDEFDAPDTDASWVRKLGERHYLTSARLELDRLAGEVGVELPAGRYRTLAGFLLHLAQSVPRTGTEIRDEDISFTIERATQQAIQEVRIHW